MKTMPPDGTDGKGQTCDLNAGVILLDIEEGRDGDGRRTFEFTIRSFDADTGEQLIRLAPRDLTKLLCVAHAVSGYVGTFDDLDPRLAGLMRHIHTFLDGLWDDPRARWERRVGCPPTEQ